MFNVINYTIPVLTNTVNCKAKNLPYIEIGDVGNCFKLKTFDVDVDWGQIKTGRLTMSEKLTHEQIDSMAIEELNVEFEKILKRDGITHEQL